MSRPKNKEKHVLKEKNEESEIMGVNHKDACYRITNNKLIFIFPQKF